jgi:hypothetical protein
MPALTIENISAEALRRLKDLAKAQGRSQAAVAAELLNGVLQTDLRSRAGLARQIRELTPTQIEQTDSTEIIRSIRDE